MERECDLLVGKAKHYDVYQAMAEYTIFVRKLKTWFH